MGLLSQNQNFESGHSSQDQSSVLGFPTEPQNFPTNVLVWGDHDQVRSASLGSNDHQHESNSTNNCNRAQEVTAVVVDIPVSSSENFSERIEEEEEEEPKSPMFTRLRSLKKLLSREKKGVVCVNGSSGTYNSNV